MHVPGFSKDLIDFRCALEMDQESTDEHQILYINRTGEDGVLVCSFQMGQTYMNLGETVAAAGGLSKIINTSKCDVYCCGLKKCRCPIA
jgi:hypothetical protein